MTRLAFCADVHLGNHRRHGGPVERSLNERCHHTVNVLRAAFVRAERANATHLIVLGDLLDGDRPEPQLLDDVLRILKSSKLTTILLAGNHEMTSDTPGDHSLAPFSSSVVVVDTPRLLTLDHVELLLVPHAAHAPAAERITKALAALPPKAPHAKARLLGVHAGIADESTAAFLKGGRGSIEALTVTKLMIEHGINYTFAGDWHDRRQWPGVLQIGALCPTGWDNPGFDGYGGIAIWDDRRDESVAKLEPSVKVIEVRGPRFVRVDSATELRELLKHPHMTDPDTSMVYVSAHVARADVPSATRLLDVQKTKGVVAAFEVFANGGDELREQAHKAASAARSTTTLDEALAVYVAGAPFELPEGVNTDHVLAKCREYLR